MGALTSARLAGLGEWQGRKYPTTQWPAIIDADIHERLARLFGDPARRRPRACSKRCATGRASTRRAAGLLGQIKDAQERREEARRDYAGRVIDRVGWLDIGQRTEDEISAARREYDRLAGSATVLSDIPPPSGSGTRGSRGAPAAGAPPSAPCCTAS